MNLEVKKAASYKLENISGTGFKFENSWMESCLAGIN